MPLKEVGQYSINVKLADELVEKIRVVITIEEDTEEEQTTPAKKISKTAEKESKSDKKTAEKESKSDKKTVAKKTKEKETNPTKKAIKKKK